MNCKRDVVVGKRGAGIWIHTLLKGWAPRERRRSAQAPTGPGDSPLEQLIEGNGTRRTPAINTKTYSMTGAN